MNDISAPVAATWMAGVNSNCSTGAANTPARAPAANDRLASATATHSATPRPNAGGQITANPPANVSTLRPPRSLAKAGQACPTMAAPTARYTAGQPPVVTPSSPAAVPFSVSPSSTGTAPAQPSWSFMFQNPGFPSPTCRGSKPRARATSTATGMEPRR